MTAAVAGVLGDLELELCQFLHNLTLLLLDQVVAVVLYLQQEAQEIPLHLTQ